jgi:CSLREA domain-containing protein
MKRVWGGRLGASVVVACALLAGAATQSTAAIKKYHVNTRSDHKPGKCTKKDCTLREAVIAANKPAAGGGKVLIPASEEPYKLTRAGADEDAAKKGDLDITDPNGITIHGAGAKKTVIKQTKKDRVFDVPPDMTFPVNFEGVTLTGGDAAGSPGGGILSLSSVSVFESAVRGNKATVGGGIAVEGSDGRLLLTASTVSGNRASVHGGGLEIIDGDAATHTILSSTISANRAPQGGGIYALLGGENLHLVTSTVTLNQSFGDDPPTYAGGGGLYFESTLSGPGIAKIAQSTITSNEGSGAAPTSARAANIYTEKTVQVENTIVALDLGGAPNCQGALDSQGHNLDGGTTCGLDQGTDLETASPDLKDLADNGGLTQTRALKGTSDAIGKGTCPGTLIQRGVDQRGEGRPSVCDIGAFERDPLP